MEVIWDMSLTFDDSPKNPEEISGVDDRYNQLFADHNQIYLSSVLTAPTKVDKSYIRYSFHQPKEFKSSIKMFGRSQNCLSKRAFVLRGDTPSYITTYRSCSHRCGYTNTPPQSRWLDEYRQGCVVLGCGTPALISCYNIKYYLLLIAHLQ
ncbi:hypothetical protein LXL04_000071 [Taraxacum kok-saghyz]